MNTHQRRLGGRGRLASAVLGAFVIGSAGAAPVAAAGVDFGSVAIGESSS